MQVSMPGMMDTVLNLGLNGEVAAGLAAKSGERFAYDSYRRFLDMIGNVVSTPPLLPISSASVALADSMIGTSSDRIGDQQLACQATSSGCC